MANLSEKAVGNPLAYLPPQALPSVCKLLARGSTIKLEVTGILRTLDEKHPNAYYLEITETRLK